MTIVEFFDKNAVENIASALLCSPDKVILVGDSGKQMKKSKEKYAQVISARGLKVDFEVANASRNNLMECVRVLSKIAEENDNCIFDLEGGDDLFLVAVGIVFDRYSDRVRLHRFNISSNHLIDCDADGKFCNIAPFDMTVNENVAIYNGRVITADESPIGTFDWDFNDEFRNDIHTMWKICKENLSVWNNQITCIAKFSANQYNTGSLEFSAPTAGIHDFLKNNTLFIEQFNSLLRKLSLSGLINSLSRNEKTVSFEFKNEQIRRTLTMAGRLLELLITKCAIDVEEKNGEKVYNDIKTGVYIDWDGIVESGMTTDVSNEIDVMLMKGLTPVFISCKNGDFEVDELYKLFVVAQRFGGEYAKKGLFVAEPIKNTAKGKYLIARAKDMDIRIIDDIEHKTSMEIEKELRTLWMQP